MSLFRSVGRVFGLGKARDGTDHFVAQRLSAIALVFLGLWFMWAMYTLDAYTYLDVMRFVASPVNGVLLSLLIATTAYHSYLGVQVVIEDYVHAQGLQFMSLMGSRFVHALLAAAGIYAVVRIGLSA